MLTAFHTHHNLITHRDTEWWCVLNPGSGVPKTKHRSQQAAEEEAMRLLKQQPHCEFIVLKCVSAVRSAPQPPPVATASFPPLPAPVAAE